MFRQSTFLRILSGIALTIAIPGALPAGQQSTKGIRHAFLASGTKTYIISHKGKELWNYPRPTREGWMLPNGNVLLVLERTRNLSGSVVEMNRNKQIIFQFRGTQHSIGSACNLDNGNYLVAECGKQPRLMEVSPNGRVARTVPVRSQSKQYGDQIRMVRQLKNGNYLVTQLADQVVREYNRTGKVVWEVKTKGSPHTAIRLKNGQTLVACTTGNCIMKFDRAGKVACTLETKDINNGSLNNVSSVQLLPNGHTVVANHNANGGACKLVELDAAKRVVWTFTDAHRPSISRFQILNTNGRPLPWPPLR